MDYTRFVALRRAGWDRFEGRLVEARRNPRSLAHDELEQLVVEYRQLLHDHALATARFPGTGAAERLAGLALAGTHILRGESGRGLPSVATLLRVSFPRAVERLRGELALAALLFAVAALTGLVIGLVRADGGAALLGADRVAALRDGHLWTEPLTTVAPSASSMIATNNMAVALVAWVGGALGGLGSLWICLVNGMLLGSVVAVTMHYHMSAALFEFIAAHGPLEITLILLSAAAGLSVGRALVVAADQPRWERVREAAASSLLVVLGSLPWFVLLGVVEAFVSPAEMVPAAMKATLGLSLEAMFLVVAFPPTAAPGGRQERGGRA